MRLEVSKKREKLGEKEKRYAWLKGSAVRKKGASAHDGKSFKECSATHKALVGW